MLLFQFFQLMKVCVCCEKGIALRSVLGVDLIGVEIWVHFEVWEGIEVVLSGYVCWEGIVE